MKKYARIVMKSFVNCPRFKKPMDYFPKILNLYGCVRSADKKKKIPFFPSFEKMPGSVYCLHPRFADA